MSALLQQIKQKRLQARKDKDGATATALTTLVGELETKAKGTGQEVTDAMVISMCEKFIKGINDFIAATNDTGVVVDLQRESDLYKQFVPQKMDEEQLTKILSEFKLSTQTYNIGSAMAYLKENFAGQYDGKLASSIAKTLN